MKILVDMNLSPDWVTVLTNHEIPAVHWSTVGDPRADDAVIMAWARTNNYTVFTHDLDFGGVLALTQAEGPRRYSSPRSRCDSKTFGTRPY